MNMATLFKLIFTLLAFGFASCTQSEEPIQISEQYQVRPYSLSTSLNSDSGVVLGYRNCGGSGRVLNHRFDLCITDLPSPCKIPVNTPGHGELAFIPREDIKGLGVRTTVTTLDDGKVKVYETLLPNANLIAGQEYAVYGAGKATPEMKGREYTYKMEFYRLSDNHVEICSEGDFLAVPSGEMKTHAEI